MIFSVKVFNFDCSVLNQERGVNENWRGENWIQTRGTLKKSLTLFP